MVTCLQPGHSRQTPSRLVTTVDFALNRFFIQWRGSDTAQLRRGMSFATFAWGQPTPSSSSGASQQQVSKNNFSLHLSCSAQLCSSVLMLCHDVLVCNVNSNSHFCSLDSAHASPVHKELQWWQRQAFQTAWKWWW